MTDQFIISNWQPKISRVELSFMYFWRGRARNESQRPASLSSFQDSHGKFHCVTHYSVEEDWPGHHLMTWMVMWSFKEKKKQSMVVGGMFSTFPDVFSPRERSLYWTLLASLYSAFTPFLAGAGNSHLDLLLSIILESIHLYKSEIYSFFYG